MLAPFASMKLSPFFLSQYKHNVQQWCKAVCPCHNRYSFGQEVKRYVAQNLEYNQVSQSRFNDVKRTIRDMATVRSAYPSARAAWKENYSVGRAWVNVLPLIGNTKHQFHGIY